MTKTETEPSGILLVDKPPNWTSHDVVKFIRGFGIRKVGHCGTLDPAATGLLVIVIGRATKLTERFAGQDKAYEGVMELGTETFSQDAEGKVIATGDWSQVTETQIRETFTRFAGEQMQVPPMVSAVKKGGKKLYEMARKGIVIDRDPRPITIHRLEIKKINLPEIHLQVKCSKGTYVRTLCADMGTELGCGAYLKNLRRTVSGRFSISEAFALEEIKTWNRDILYTKFLPLTTALTYL